MNPLEITLIVIGIIIIVISCILVDRTGGARLDVKDESDLDKYTNDQINRLTKDINEKLSRVSEEVVVQADDYLSKISNEKIMSLNEFSEQIIEKIKHNHDEVIFLYNMLTDKEKELKVIVREIDTTHKKVEELIEKKNPIRLQADKKSKQSTSQRINDGIEAQRDKLKVEAPSISASAASKSNNENTNNNTQILALHDNGKSIIEISKLLGLGQGEVKLVLDLYRNKRQ